MSETPSPEISNDQGPDTAAHYQHGEHITSSEITNPLTEIAAALGSLAASSELSLETNDALKNTLRELIGEIHTLNTAVREVTEQQSDQQAVTSSEVEKKSRIDEVISGLREVREAVEGLGQPKNIDRPPLSPRDDQLGLTEEPRTPEEAEEAKLLAQALNISIYNSLNAHPVFLSNRLGINEQHAIELMRELARRGYIENPAWPDGRKFSEGAELHQTQSLRVLAQFPRNIPNPTTKKILQPYLKAIEHRRLSDDFPLERFQANT